MAVYFEDINIGQEIPRLVKGPLQKLQHVIYAGASGDFNPLHTDDDFAKMVGMKDGVITHGMFIMGIIGQAITDWVPKKDLKKFGVRFMGMTRPGNTITVTGNVVDKIADGNIIVCEVQAADESGDIKATGRFTAKFPAKG